MKTPWHHVNGISFMKEMLLNIQDGDGEAVTSLTVIPRKDVASRRWWTLEWTASDGTRQTVSASTAERVFEDAAERETIIRSAELNRRASFGTISQSQIDLMNKKAEEESENV